MPLDIDFDFHHAILAYSKSLICIIYHSIDQGLLIKSSDSKGLATVDLQRNVCILDIDLGSFFYDKLRHTKSLKTGPHCPRQPIRHPNVIGQCEPAINLVLDCVLVSSLFESNYWLRLFR